MTMTRRVTIPLIFAVLAGLLYGCSGSRERQPSAARKERTTANRDSALLVRADSLMRELTPRERAGMLIMPAIYTRSDAATLQLLTDYASTDHVGGIVLLKGDSGSARIITDSLRRMGREDLLVSIDAEWGLGMRLSDAAVYPDNRSLGDTATTAWMYRYGAAVGRASRSLGIDMVLGPVLDVIPEEGNAFIGKRSFGSDARRVSELGCAYSRGVESAGVLTAAKHFPGHGSAQEDSHDGLPVLYRSLHSLQQSDLEPFRKYIDSGMSAVMVGHISIPAIDTELRSAAVSYPVITELLREDMHFGGLILTDALNMGGAGSAQAWEAIAAGADMVLAPVSTVEAIDGIMKAVEEGKLRQSDVDAHCRRILYNVEKLRERRAGVLGQTSD